MSFDCARFSFRIRSWCGANRETELNGRTDGQGLLCCVYDMSICVIFGRALTALKGTTEQTIGDIRAQSIGRLTDLRQRHDGCRCCCCCCCCCRYFLRDDWLAIIYCSTSVSVMEFAQVQCNCDKTRRK